MSKSSEWFKSSYSGANGQCVEAKRTASGAVVRDTKNNGTGPEIAFLAKAWTAFLNRIK